MEVRLITCMDGMERLTFILEVIMLEVLAARAPIV
jgi:hypothetical protein